MQFREHPALRGKRDYYMVDPKALKVEANYNVRDLSTKEAMEKLAELEASIVDHGVEQPLEVRLVGDDLIVVQGHRRLAAVLSAISKGHEIVSIPVIPEGKGVNAADRTADLVISNSGEPLTALETAEVVKRLFGYGWDRTKIAARFGWSGAKVDYFQSLLATSPEVQTMIKAGEVSASLAVEVTRRDGDKAIETLKEAKKTVEAKVEAQKKAGAAPTSKRAKVTAKAIAQVRGEAKLTDAQIRTLLSALDKIAKVSSEPVSSEIAIAALKKIAVAV